MRQLFLLQYQRVFSLVVLLTLIVAAYSSPLANAQRTVNQDQSWDTFQSANTTSNKAFLKYNSLTGTVTKAYRFLWKSPLAKNNPVETANSFLNENKDWLGFDRSNLDLRLVRNYPYKDNRYVRFQQFREGMEIIDATFQLTVSAEGVTSVGGKLYSDRYISGVASLSESTVLFKAKQYLELDSSELEGRLILKLLPRPDEYYLEPVYDIRLSDQIVRVSAESGRIIYSYQVDMGASSEETEGDVRELKTISAELSRQTCAEVTAAGKGYTTNPSNPDNDTAGESITLQRLCANPPVSLDGKYTKVYQYDNNGLIPHDGSNTFLYPPVPKAINSACSGEGPGTFPIENHDCSYFDGVNVYYHIDEIAYYMDNTIGVNLLDTTYRYPAYVHDANRSSTYGAWALVGTAENYPDPRIEFAHRHAVANGGIFFDAAKFEDIIFHEYGHVLVWVTGQFDSDNSIKRALHEGFADFLAAAYSDDAEIAEKLVRCPVHYLGDPPDLEDPLNAGATVDYLRSVSVPASTWNGSDLNSTNLRFNECEFARIKTLSPLSWEAVSIWIGAKETNSYGPGLVWASTLWDLRNKGTREDAIQLVIDGLVEGEGSASTLAEAAAWLIEAKDKNPTSYSSITMAEIIETFVDREIFPDIDVDYEIPSGTTSTYESGTLKFGSDVQLTVKGTLTADTFIFEDQGSGTWDGIYVEGTLNLDGSTIRDVSVATGTGSIDCVSCTLNLDNTTVTVPASTNNYAITSTGTLNIEGGTFRSDDYSTIKTTGSASVFYPIDSEFISANDDYVLNAQTGSDMYLHYQGTGSNTIKGLGLNAEGGSTIDAGDDVADFGEQDFCRTTGNVKFRAIGSGSIIIGEYSYFPSGNDPDEVTASGGVIYYSGNEGSSSCSTGKRGSSQIAGERIQRSHTLPQLIRRLANRKGSSEILSLLNSPESLANGSQFAGVMSEIRSAFKQIDDRSFREALYTASSKFSSLGYPYDLLIAQFALIEGRPTEAAKLFVEVAGRNNGSEVGNQALTELALISMKDGNYAEATYFVSQIVELPSSDVEAKSSMYSLIQKGRRNSSEAASKNGSALRERFEAEVNSGQGEVWNLSAYPNPFNPQTVIQFELKTGASVLVQVVDLLGRVVEVLVEKKLASGNHSVNFTSSGMASGVYFVRISTDKGVNTMPIVFMK